MRTGKCRKAAAFILLLTGIFLCCTLFFSGAAESLPYQNYSYDKYRKALPAPAAYASSRRIDATWLDTPLNDPRISVGLRKGISISRTRGITGSSGWTEISVWWPS